MTEAEKKKLEEEIVVLEAELDRQFEKYRQMCEKHRAEHGDLDSEVSWEIFSSTCSDYFMVHVAPLRDLVADKKALLLNE